MPISKRTAEINEAVISPIEVKSSHINRVKEDELLAIRLRELSSPDNRSKHA